MNLILRKYGLQKEVVCDLQKLLLQANKASCMYEKVLDH